MRSFATSLALIAGLAQADLGLESAGLEYVPVAQELSEAMPVAEELSIASPPAPEAPIEDANDQEEQVE